MNIETQEVEKLGVKGDVGRVQADYMAVLYLKEESDIR